MFVLHTYFVFVLCVLNFSSIYSTQLEVSCSRPLSVPLRCLVAADSVHPITLVNLYFKGFSQSFLVLIPIQISGLIYSNDFITQ